MNNPPGIVACAARADEMVERASGVANARTGVEMTADTLFLIGSISKVWTAALVTALGIELDARVREFLPSFRLADDEAAATVTVRHLLTHTSGIDGGDYLVDFGRGDDAIARYVDSLSSLSVLHPPGAMRSYCNAGFVVAGRIIEVVTGKTFDSAQRELLIEPLGLNDTFTLPEEALLRRCAVGHVNGAVTSTWAYPRACAPAGSVITSTARDLVRFGAAQFDAPKLSWGTGPGYCGHSGGSPGGVASLRIFPEAGISAASFANSSDGAAAAHQAQNALLAEAFGFEVPPAPGVEAPGAASEPRSGVYERYGYRITVDGATLTVVTTQTMPPLTVAGTTDVFTLEPGGDDLFFVTEPRLGGRSPVRFVDRGEYVMFANRAHRRVR